ncbi:MAG: hypothetical protein QOE66_2049, partial [Chloroflexota bacterium]|nr:hypothetical protein [Chloroflexota bacterium]
MNDPTISRRLDAPGVVGVVVCCLLWGGNAVAVKVAIPDLPPLGCAALRFLLALIYLVASDRTAHRAESDIALPGEDA